MKRNLDGFRKYLTKGLGIKKGLKIVVFLFIPLGLCSWSFGAEVELTGAGATFPYPLYSKMFDIYHKEHGAKFNYQAIGSGGGIRQLINKTVDFGGSNAIMSDQSCPN